MLLGDFEIHAVLGNGGSGIVYDARWGFRRVALKVLHEHLVASERERAQWVAEAQRLQAMAHPGIVKVLACGELPDGRPYLAMEHLDGDTLAARLARGPLGIDDALPLFAELCSAVGALHERGLVHRDLKPENVVVCDGHAVLLDFGIAKELDAPASTTTQDGGVRGTPAYMAPERFFGQPASVATDVYELAVILYAMLAGRLPWDDHADPEARLSPRPLDVGEALDQEVRRAMSTRAQNRPTSAAALLAAISAAVEAETPPSAAETARLGKAAISEAPAPHVHPTMAPAPNPLAWPTPPAVTPPGGMPPRRSRTRVLAGGALAVAALGGLAIWQLAPGGAATPSSPGAPPATPIGSSLVTATPAPATPDPWSADTPASEAAAPVVRTLALTEPVGSPAEERREIAAALAYLPADTKIVGTASVTALRASQLAPLLAKLDDNPQLATMVEVLPPCTRELIATATWLVAGIADLDDPRGALIVRGRWTQAAVRACFEVQETPAKLGDNGKLWLDFIDEHTAYLTLGEQAIHPPARGKLPAKLARVVAAQPLDRTLGFATIGEDLAWPAPVPRGAEVSGWFRFEPGDAASLAVTLDAHDAASAAALQTTISAQLIEGFAGKPMLGLVTATRTGTVVRISGRVTSLLVGLVASAVP